MISDKDFTSIACKNTFSGGLFSTLTYQFNLPNFLTTDSPRKFKLKLLVFM
jgi:hypothetical protein